VRHKRLHIIWFHLQEVQKQDWCMVIREQNSRPGMVAQTHNPSHSGGRRITIWGQPGQKVCKTPSQPAPGCEWHMPVIPAMWESTGRRTEIQAGLDINWDSISNTISAKRAGRVAQVVEYLPTKHKALSSISSSLLAPPLFKKRDWNSSYLGNMVLIRKG
jgi:hypothetical protein